MRSLFGALFGLMVGMIVSLVMKGERFVNLILEVIREPGYLAIILMSGIVGWFIGIVHYKKLTHEAVYLMFVLIGVLVMLLTGSSWPIAILSIFLISMIWVLVRYALLYMDKKFKSD